MTRKKGGGRESGGTDGGNRGAVRETSAAAYPAAHVHRIMNDEEPPYPEDCLPCAEREKRIRVLEAEVAYRRSYDTGDFSSFQKVLGEWKVRAEKAEARIAELEASQ